MRLTIVEGRPRARPRAETLRARSLGLLALAGLGLTMQLLDVPLPLIARAAATLAPLALGGLGILFLLRALAEGAHLRTTASVARQLQAAVPSDFSLLPRYLPRDSGDGEVDLVVIGPTGVFVIDVRDLPGDVVCYQDVWYRRSEKRSLRLADSPSRLARWNALRVRGDLANGGFAKTSVQPLVLIASGHLADVASACVPVVEGVPALAAHLTHKNGRSISLERAHALAGALRAPQLPKAS